MGRKLLALCLVLAVIAIAAAGCEGYFSPSAPKLPSASSGIVLSQQNTGIWVTGEGKVSIVPDVAILSLGVEAQAATVAEAQSQASTAMAAVVAELENHGIAKKDIKTQHFSIIPIRRWIEDKGQEVLVGYRVTNTVTTKVRKVENAGAIIDAVAKAGGDFTRINSLSFTVDDPTAYRKEVREKAMADAEAKAKQLAALSGVQLDKPTYISESGGFIPLPIPYRVEAAPAAAPTPISPGETQIQLSVQVVYSIK